MTADSTSPAPETGHLDPRIVRTRHDVLGTTLRLLLGDDPGSVTHANVAKLAGYSKATIYKHWPTRQDLLADALAQVGDVEHHTLTGDLRDDLIGEVGVYRREMEQHHLHRALMVLVQMTESTPDLVPVREKLVRDGERIVRELLAPHLAGTDLDAATLMLVGGILQSALMHGTAPSDEVIAASVDIVLSHVRA